MWHLCEEAHAEGVEWHPKLEAYCDELCRLHPMKQEDITKWYFTCFTQFPIYVDYWAEQQDVTLRTPLFQEVSFRVPYELPSGRKVLLRGKWDSVDILDAHEHEGRQMPRGIWLQENKTKGDVDQAQILRQLKFDLQTMIYLVALQQDPMSGYESEGHYASDVPPHPILGVRYNVIRRPFSGGKGTIKKHAAKSTAPVYSKRKGQEHVVLHPAKTTPEETDDHFYGRLAEDYIAKDPEEWFFRWKVPVSPEEIEAFKIQCLNPILENLCCWWDSVNYKPSPLPYYAMNWRHPFGVFNPLDEGYVSDLDEYLATGSLVGLQRVDNLFPELK